MQVEMYKSLGFMGYPDYMVSRSGKVLSKNYHLWGKEKVLKPQKNVYGYLYVDLRKNKNKKRFLVHRLVALAWLPNPDNLPQVNHKDENKTNNSVFNLEWCTALYNNNYGSHYEHILETRKTSEKWKQGCKCRIEKVSKKVYQYTKDLELVSIWKSATEASKYGFRQTNICKCCNNKFNREGNNVYKGFIWSYERLE